VEACRLVWEWVGSGTTVGDVRMRARLAPPSMCVGVDEVMRAVDTGVESGLLARSGDWLERATRDVWTHAWVAERLWEADPAAWAWSQRYDAGEGAAHLARKVDDRARRELGLAGERAFMDAARALLPQHLHREVVHVAETDDTAGFDVLCPSTANFFTSACVEVKATVRPPGSVAFFLTRNEARVGARNPSWRLVVMRRIADTWLPAGYVPFFRLRPHLPDDRGAGLWESCHVNLSDEELVPGLP
jgi:hypothetical protein